MSESTKSRRSSSRKGKVRKEFWLDPKSLRQAQTLLGAETERCGVGRARSHPGHARTRPWTVPPTPMTRSRPEYRAFATADRR